MSFNNSTNNSTNAVLESPESLGDRMKKYESAPLEHVNGQYVLPINKPFIARIDGHSFSKFTKGFMKPYDVVLSKAMEMTTADLLTEFNARTAYTQSDEISLVFVPTYDEESETYRPLPFNGRMVKLATLMASFAATRFNLYLSTIAKEFFDLNDNDEKNNPYSCSTIDKILGSYAYFDCRLFPVPDLKEVYNNIYWRSAHDCARNAIFGFARKHFSQKELHKKNTKEMLKMLQAIGVDYDKEMPDQYKYGIFIKRERYTIDAVDRKTNQPIKATRTRTKSFSKRLIGYDEGFANLIGKKNLPDFPLHPILGTSTPAHAQEYAYKH